MIHALQYRRLWLMTGLLVFSFLLLGFRLVDLQVLRHEEFSRRADERYHVEYMKPPNRGRILDVNGEVLATSSDMYKDICADPSLLKGGADQVAELLAPILEIPVNELKQQLAYREYVTDEGKVIVDQFELLVRQAPMEMWKKVKDRMEEFSFGLNIQALSQDEQQSYRSTVARIRRGIFFQEKPARVYPNGPLAAHALGFTQLQQTNMGGNLFPVLHGIQGMEHSLDRFLQGTFGYRKTQKNVRREEVVEQRTIDVHPRDGYDAWLTIDARLQQIVERELERAMKEHRPVSASSVVLRPKTGEILAYACLPSYDPNHPGDSTAGERRNRIITDQFDPGSTFKAMTIAAALDEGVVDLSNVFHCENGLWNYGPKPLHDHGHGYGELTVQQIVQKSSNIGAAKIAIALGEEELEEYIRAFGFGERTGIPLRGEIRGALPSKWRPMVTITRVPMGHSISVTHLQMVYAMSAIANNGVLMAPKLLARMTDSSGKVVAELPERRVRRVLSEKATRKVVAALKTVPTPQGTAAQAAMEDYVVAGKTGTAEKLVNGRYRSDLHYASFIGFFPADNPELCISVILDEPKGAYYGGAVAGPIFRRIAEFAAVYYQIPPDRPPEKLSSNSTGRAFYSAAGR